MTKAGYKLKTKASRNQNILKYYRTGNYTMQAIARIFQISRARVCQILKREEGKVNG